MNVNVSCCNEDVNVPPAGNTRMSKLCAAVYGVYEEQSFQTYTANELLSEKHRERKEEKERLSFSLSLFQNTTRSLKSFSCESRQTRLFVAFLTVRRETSGSYLWKVSEKSDPLNSRGHKIVIIIITRCNIRAHSSQCLDPLKGDPDPLFLV